MLSMISAIISEENVRDAVLMLIWRIPAVDEETPEVQAASLCVPDTVHSDEHVTVLPLKPQLVKDLAGHVRVCSL